MANQHRPTLDEVYLRMLDIFARRSTCARRQVAAIITTLDGKVLATGYNGVPRGIVHCVDVPCLGATDPPGDTRACLAVHAEQNALLQCGARINEASVLYCSCTPCFECAKLIANTNIGRIIVNEKYADERGKALLEKRAIKVEEPDEPDEPISDTDNLQG